MQSIKMSPLVGIVCKSSDNDLVRSGSADSVARSYRLAAAAVGLQARILPTDLTAREYGLMTDCFGFILAGGASEVSIGLELENANHSLDLKRDELESTVVAHARESGKPLFCICRGMQLLNATLGGSNGVLNQDQLERHRRLDTPFQTTVHAVKLVTGSSTRRILGAPIVQVNSAHGFAVSRVAENARITAFSDDCVAEGIEVPSDFWTVGVQWHPESLLADPRQLALFENFADHILEASSSR